MATQNYQNHPLPVPPNQAYYQQPHQYYHPHSQQNSAAERPLPKSRSSRAFSFRSDKSKESGHGHNKIDLHETSAEKEAKRLHSKADPSVAMNEAEPAVVAAMAKTSMAPLRSIQHRDAAGQPIADPDRSNPTRNRWERPLDTIRSFEAAIDGGYKNRNSFIRSDTDSIAGWNRRSSYYGNNGPRFPQDSYYGGRGAHSMRPESQFENNRQSLMMGRENYGDAYDTPYGPPRRYSRMHSEPYINHNARAQQGVYPIPNNHRSYETVTSAANSGSVQDPSGYQTDPTSGSENSSIERRSPAKRQEPVNDYGISFQSPGYQVQNFNMGAGGAAMNGPPPPPPHGANSGMAPPAVPRKDSGGSILRKVSRAAPPSAQQQRPDMGEKRKSWFSRRFSKAS